VTTTKAAVKISCRSSDFSPIQYRHSISFTTVQSTFSSCCQSF